MSHDLVDVSHQPIERVEIDTVEVSLSRLLAGDMPAFIIETPHQSLDECLSKTALRSILLSQGYIRDTHGHLEFNHVSGTYKSPSLNDAEQPSDFASWYAAGVTPFHVDTLSDRKQISFNFTRSGEADFYFHENGILEALPSHSQNLSVTKSLLQHQKVDPTLINPEGYHAKVSAGDLTVFNSFYAHAVRSTKLPRSSEVTFFDLYNKVDC